MDLIAMAGCGALGSRMALELARPGREFLLLDDDVVEERNLPASTFHAHQVGQRKVEALAELLWWRGRCPCQTSHKTLTAKNLGLFNGARLVVVTFDNAEARNLCNRLDVPVVQVGMSDRGTGAVHWGHADFGEDEHPRGHNPVCTGDLSVALIRLVVATASNEVERWLETGRTQDVFVTENEWYAYEPFLDEDELRMARNTLARFRTDAQLKKGLNGKVIEAYTVKEELCLNVCMREP